MRFSSHLVTAIGLLVAVMTGTSRGAEPAGPPKPRCLVIQGSNRPDQHEQLVKSLRQQGIEVVVRRTGRLDPGLAELKTCDAVLLADVPRKGLTDAQLKALVSSTRESGRGLILLGGRDSFGAGDWMNSPLDAISPLEFDLSRRRPKLPRARVVILAGTITETDRDGTLQRAVAREAVRTLGDDDLAGLLYFDHGGKWAWGLPSGLAKVGPARAEMHKQIDQRAPVEDLEPLLKQAARALGQTEGRLNEIVLISDGTFVPPAKPTIDGLVDAKITVSTVSIGAPGPPNSKLLMSLAQAGHGRYYKVSNPKALPDFARRAGGLAIGPLIHESAEGFRPLIHNAQEGIRPRIKARHEILRGIEEPLPLVRGFNLTHARQDPAVEVLLEIPIPHPPSLFPLLAVWRAGRGNVAALTSDGDKQWMSDWSDKEVYGRLLGQLVRWATRPATGAGAAIPSKMK